LSPSCSTSDRKLCKYIYGFIFHMKENLKSELSSFPSINFVYSFHKMWVIQLLFLVYHVLNWFCDVKTKVNYMSHFPRAVIDFKKGKKSQYVSWFQLLPSYLHIGGRCQLFTRPDRLTRFDLNLIWPDMIRR
jgi:hypothetical protein